MRETRLQEPATGQAAQHEAALEGSSALGPEDGRAPETTWCSPTTSVLRLLDNFTDARQSAITEYQSLHDVDHDTAVTSLLAVVDAALDRRGKVAYRLHLGTHQFRAWGSILTFDTECTTLLHYEVAAVKVTIEPEGGHLESQGQVAKRGDKGDDFSAERARLAECANITERCVEIYAHRHHLDTASARKQLFNLLDAALADPRSRISYTTTRKGPALKLKSKGRFFIVTPDGGLLLELVETHTARSYSDVMAEDAGFQKVTADDVRERIASGEPLRFYPSVLHTYSSMAEKKGVHPAALHAEIEKMLREATTAGTTVEAHRVRGALVWRIEAGGFFWFARRGGSVIFKVKRAGEKVVPKGRVTKREWNIYTLANGRILVDSAAADRWCRGFGPGAVQDPVAVFTEALRASEVLEGKDHDDFLVVTCGGLRIRLMHKEVTAPGGPVEHVLTVLSGDVPEPDVAFVLAGLTRGDVEVRHSAVHAWCIRHKLRKAREGSEEYSQHVDELRSRLAETAASQGAVLSCSEGRWVWLVADKDHTYVVGGPGDALLTITDSDSALPRAG